MTSTDNEIMAELATASRVQELADALKYAAAHLRHEVFNMRWCHDVKTDVNGALKRLDVLIEQLAEEATDAEFDRVKIAPNDTATVASEVDGLSARTDCVEDSYQKIQDRLDGQHIRADRQMDEIVDLAVQVKTLREFVLANQRKLASLESEVKCLIRTNGEHIISKALVDNHSRWCEDLESKIENMRSLHQSVNHRLTALEANRQVAKGNKEF